MAMLKQVRAYQDQAAMAGLLIGGFVMGWEIAEHFDTFMNQTLPWVVAVAAITLMISVLSYREDKDVRSVASGSPVEQQMMGVYDCLLCGTHQAAWSLPNKCMNCRAGSAFLQEL